MTANAFDLIALHAMYSMSFLELWSLTQGSYSLQVLQAVLLEQKSKIDAVRELAAIGKASGINGLTASSLYGSLVALTVGTPSRQEVGSAQQSCVRCSTRLTTRGPASDAVVVVRASGHSGRVSASVHKPLAREVDPSPSVGRGRFISRCAPDRCTELIRDDQPLLDSGAAALYRSKNPSGVGPLADG